MRYHLSLGELLAAIPAVLDAAPSDSVVALSLNLDGMPTCALVIPRRALLDEHDGAHVALAVADELAQDGSQVAVLVSYANQDVRMRCDALEVLRLEVEFKIPHVEILAVQDGRWFRPGCTDPACCAALGRNLPPAPAWLPRVLAEARDRAMRCGPASNAERERLKLRAVAADSWEAALSAGTVPDAPTARALATALDDLCVRDWVVLTLLGADAETADEALAGLDSGSVGEALDAALCGSAIRDPLAADRARMVVERVARAARGRRRRAATHTLAAILDWWEGNLLAARDRCDLALASDPDYRLAVLVRLASSRGIGPGWATQSGRITR